MALRMGYFGVGQELLCQLPLAARWPQVGQGLVLNGLGEDPPRIPQHGPQNGANTDTAGIVDAPACD